MPSKGLQRTLNGLTMAFKLKCPSPGPLEGPSPPPTTTTCILVSQLQRSFFYDAGKFNHCLLQHRFTTGYQAGASTQVQSSYNALLFLLPQCSIVSYSIDDALALQRRRFNPATALFLLPQGSIVSYSIDALALPQRRFNHRQWQLQHASSSMAATTTLQSSSMAATTSAEACGYLPLPDAAELLD